jgi:hypothetical protein
MDRILFRENEAPLSSAWNRELAEATINVDFELGFDLSDRADKLAETLVGKVLVGSSGRDIIYKTLREGAILFKERELNRGEQEAREAAEKV